MSATPLLCTPSPDAVKCPVLVVTPSLRPLGIQLLHWGSGPPSLANTSSWTTQTSPLTISFHWACGVTSKNCLCYKAGSPR